MDQERHHAEDHAMMLYALLTLWALLLAYLYRDDLQNFYK
jgi:hypothetical protein